MVETDFWSCRNRFLLINLFFFLQVETFTEISGNKFIWERICSGRKEFFQPVETILFYSVLLYRKWKPLMKLVETSSLYFS